MYIISIEQLYLLMNTHTDIYIYKKIKMYLKLYKFDTIYQNLNEN